MYPMWGHEEWAVSADFGQEAGYKTDRQTDRYPASLLDKQSTHWGTCMCFFTVKSLAKSNLVDIQKGRRDIVAAVQTTRKEHL